MSLLLLSIDPGTRALGWAYWSQRDETLIAAGCSRVKAVVPGSAALARGHVENIRIPDSIARPYQCAAAVVEHMEAKAARATTPQDLIEVEAVGCLVAASLAANWALIGASEWKGTIPKEIHHPRLLEVLNAAELMVVNEALIRVPVSNHKEVLDAVGIGLYYLRRTNRSGGKRVT